MIKIYGIPNCDTMKKAMKWLDSNGIAYEFHNYKKQPAPKDVIERALTLHGWNTVLNTRGTTWRGLPTDVKDNMNDGTALSLALENPSIIKRPLLEREDGLYFGFTPEGYTSIFA